jgi:hypothetical protein
MMSFTIDEILRGTGPGPAQSVGQMSVIPLIGEDDDTFAPPVLEVGTSGYGTVVLRNDADRPTLVPPGAGWVVAQKAQDHALGGGALVRPGETRQIDTAMCVQQGQGGFIARARHEMTILPVSLRTKALGVRHVRSYSKLWESIEAFNKSHGIEQRGGHLEFFVRAFQKELETFVAELEVVPRQVGAIIFVGGEVAGVERAPSAAFWRALWVPLVRVCYGSLAIAVARENKAPPATRSPLRVEARSIAGLRDALARARDEEHEAVSNRVQALRGTELTAAEAPEETLGSIALTTLASPRLSGQVVTIGKAVRFASLCAAA